MARFFIRRPVFAWVLAIVVMLAGLFGVTALPISQYPEIAPTTVRISATYSGASAETVENSVTTVIEDGMTGLDGLLYIEATAAEGTTTLTLTFDSRVQSDIAQVQVQNKLQLVQSKLPPSVTAKGISVTRSGEAILLVGALISDNDTYSSVELGDIFATQLEDRIARIDGVGDIREFATQYAMRIWLDPHKLYQYQLTARDVTAAVEDQNTNVTVGSLGDEPTVKGQQMTVSLAARSQLTSVADFEGILLKTNPDGSAVHLSDVARIELGKENYDIDGRYDGRPAAGFGVTLQSGANAIDTADAVRAVIADTSGALPAGVSVVYPYDTTPFVKASIDRVYRTLAEAVVLVVLVIMLFLQSWRATLIPAIAVPVVLLGTFGVLAAFGMSINTLTMFALVLAIGLLVDDAIVVVENVERVMRDEGLDPVAATEKSMGEISTALVGIVLVLSSVFLPMAFMTGSVGVIYRQFSVTIIAAMGLSLLVALTLTPALCAQLLRPGRREAFLPARLFNAALDRLTQRYTGAVARVVRRAFRMLLVVAVVAGGIAFVYLRLPTAFIPTEDQGALTVIFTLPQSATTTDTLAAVKAVESYLLEDEKASVAAVYAEVGFAYGNSGQNAAMMFVALKDFSARPGPDQMAQAIVERANKHFAGNRFGRIIVTQPPVIPGLGNASGFQMYLIDEAGRGNVALYQAADALVAKAAATGKVAQLRGNDFATEPSLRLAIDQEKATAFGLTLADVNANLATIFAGTYVNDFPLGTDLREVIVEGDARWRMQPSDIYAWSARNAGDEMVPFDAFLGEEWQQISPKLQRYGGSRALQLSGSSAPGSSSGAAMDTMAQLSGELEGGYGVAWTGLSYQERLAGSQEALLYALSALVVFLCLAALYESWTVPFAVILAVPVGVLGALLATWAVGLDNDVYFKVGMLTTIGLGARNAILIVEFAETLRKAGTPLVEATVEAARLRLRPILMTSLAFGFGVLPLTIASGAGAGAQHSIGTGMLGGILFAAAFGILMAPALYVAVVEGARRVGGLLRGGRVAPGT